jgi:hypothetical protein
MALRHGLCIADGPTVQEEHHRPVRRRVVAVPHRRDMQHHAPPAPVELHGQRQG